VSCVFSAGSVYVQLSVAVCNFCVSFIHLCFSAGLLYFSHSYMMEKLETNVVSWAILHTKAEFMAYVSAVCFDLQTVKQSLNSCHFQRYYIFAKQLW